MKKIFIVLLPLISCSTTFQDKVISEHYLKPFRKILPEIQNCYQTHYLDKNINEKFIMTYFVTVNENNKVQDVHVEEEKAKNVDKDFLDCTYVFVKSIEFTHRRKRKFELKIPVNFYIKGEQNQVIENNLKVELKEDT